VNQAAALWPKFNEYAETGHTDDHTGNQITRLQFTQLGNRRHRRRWSVIIESSVTEWLTQGTHNLTHAVIANLPFLH